MKARIKVIFLFGTLFAERNLSLYFIYDGKSYQIKTSFQGIKNKKEIEISINWKEEIKGLSHLFGETNIISLYTSEWNTSNVTTMKFMFLNCKFLTYLPEISKWNTSKVTDMAFLFWNCHSLRYIDILNGIFLM